LPVVSLKGKHIPAPDYTISDGVMKILGTNLLSEYVPNDEAVDEKDVDNQIHKKKKAKITRKGN